MEDAVDCDQSCNVIRVTFCEFVPHQHHRHATSNADEDKATHVTWFAAQEDDRQQEHKPVLHQRKPKDAFVTEHLSQLFVAHFRQGWEHHDDEADGDGDVRRPTLKVVDQAGRGRNEVPNGNADRHRQKDPERQEAVQE